MQTLYVEIGDLSTNYGRAFTKFRIHDTTNIARYFNGHAKKKILNMIALQSKYLRHHIDCKWCDSPLKRSITASKTATNMNNGMEAYFIQAQWTIITSYLNKCAQCQ